MIHGAQRLLRVSAFSFFSLGCHVGSPDELGLAPLQVVATYPVADAGTHCEPVEAGCGVERRVTLEFRLNRFLRPDTAVRQSVRLWSGPQRIALLQPEYDLVERVLLFRLPGDEPLLPDTLYSVELPLPEDDPNGWGLRAFDGASLAPGEVPLRFSFRTGQHLGAPRPQDPTPACADLAEVLDRGGCGNGGCHRGPEPAMGLALTSREELTSETVGRVARQAETGPLVGRPLRNPERWGMQMPRVAAGEPANSYVLYKLLLRSENFWPEGNSDRACESRYQVDLGGQCPAPSEQERNQLRAWFVRGGPMPASEMALHREDLRTLQRWIQGGVVCR